MRNRFEALDIDYTDEELDMILTTYRGAAKKVWGGGGQRNLVGHR